jgi:hypothetical protein
MGNGIYYDNVAGRLPAKISTIKNVDETKRAAMLCFEKSD